MRTSCGSVREYRGTAWPASSIRDPAGAAIANQAGIRLYTSSRRVTGPSFTSDTLMRAPKAPPCAPSAERTRS